MQCLIVASLCEKGKFLTLIFIVFGRIIYVLFVVAE